MTRSKNYVVLRAVEVGLGAAVVVILLVAINGGWFATGAQKFSDWYASEVDGMLAVTVVSTLVTLPQVERADLPLLPVESPAPDAPADDAATTAGPSTASPSAASPSAS